MFEKDGTLNIVSIIVMKEIVLLILFYNRSLYVDCFRKYVFRGIYRVSALFSFNESNAMREPEITVLLNIKDMLQISDKNVFFSFFFSYVQVIQVHFPFSILY